MRRYRLEHPPRYWATMVSTPHWREDRPEMIRLIAGYGWNGDIDGRAALLLAELHVMALEAVAAVGLGRGVLVGCEGCPLAAGALSEPGLSGCGVDVCSTSQPASTTARISTTIHKRRIEGSFATENINRYNHLRFLLNSQKSISPKIHDHV
ncbi:hypothetical protein BH24CHL1_BH24CHL1_19120 [soil metagenome]